MQVNVTDLGATAEQPKIEFPCEQYPIKLSVITAKTMSRQYWKWCAPMRQSSNRPALTSS